MAPVRAGAWWSAATRAVEEESEEEGELMVKIDPWDEMRCPECDTWFYPEKNTRKWCQVCNDKEGEGNE